MAETKFTPASWEYEEVTHIVSKDGQLIASVSGKNEEEAEANARLISVAPAMYDLLDTIRKNFQDDLAEPIDEILNWVNTEL
ncbi:MAG: hypothetical protein IJP96_07495 [Synergistaceae bacterium]|nr:hypothetical protein [Synergistaceae bacterium]